MTAPAAIRATYSDLRFVKSRKVAQITLEVPIEEAANIVAMFGTPNPASETWVALARLGGASVPQAAPEKERRRFSELPPAQQAALKCQDEAFRRWLWEAHYFPTEDEDDVAEWIRVQCEVKSRADLNTNPEAAERWLTLLREFDVWMKAPV